MLGQAIQLYCQTLALRQFRFINFFWCLCQLHPLIGPFTSRCRKTRCGTSASQGCTSSLPSFPHILPPRARLDAKPHSYQHSRLTDGPKVCCAHPSRRGGTQICRATQTRAATTSEKETHTCTSTSFLSIALNSRNYTIIFFYIHVKGLSCRFS